MIPLNRTSNYTLETTPEEDHLNKTTTQDDWITW